MTGVDKKVINIIQHLKNRYIWTLEASQPEEKLRQRYEDGQASYAPYKSHSHTPKHTHQMPETDTRLHYQTSRKTSATFM